MGIRESLEKPDQDLNLKDFTMPEDEPESEFDIDKEITNQDFEKVKQELEQYRQQDDMLLSECIILALAMKNVFPEKNSGFEIDENTWQLIIEKLNDFKNEKKVYSEDLFFSRAMYTKLFSPEKASEIDLNEQDFKKLEQDYYDYRLRAKWEDLANIAVEIKILFPEKFPDLNLEQIWPTLLLEFREHLDPVGFSGYCKNLRIIFPEKISLLTLNKEAWQGRVKKLKNYRQQNLWSLFVFEAEQMKILTAKEVKITDQGLELVMPEKKSFQQKTPPRPERRNF